MTPPRRDNNLVRPYVVTGGRSRGRIDIDLVSLIVAGTSSAALAPDAPPEAGHLLALCRGGVLSVAEIAAYLERPVSVIKVLLSDLAESGHIAARAPAATAERSDIRLLEDLLNGLRALA
ncbi:DUF742 domain-containing protein [Streptosporangium sp. NPDC048047]|uniref:DUF742 domain-containing protein n=1 Tax=Streptosporangium sp. NPDC048047 TaxID=3155748 RepID=UPI003445CDB7